MPTIITRGAMTARGYGFGASAATAATYIEDVFSTYLYDGTGSSLTITNGVDLSTKGGLTWLKRRNGVANHQLYDTARGTTKRLVSNTNGAESTVAQGLTAFNSDGFTLGTDSVANTGGNTYASWTFRKQAKFFDVVTYTGNNTDARTISHNLGSTPGCIIVKNLTAGTDWMVWHTSLGTTGGAYYNLRLNTTAATAADNMLRGANSTTFTVSNDTEVNGTSSNTYVAYLFAHDAGGFGASGSDNVISCGSYTGNGSATGPSVTLGYEPQWVLIKRSSASGNDWQLYDSMRGLATGDGGDNGLFPNSTSAEDTNATIIKATATGFQLETTSAALNANGSTYIYIAIRRGPMKTPTSGTSVFVPVAGTGSYSGVTMTTNFPADAVLDNKRNGTGDHYLFDRLRSTYGTNYLATASTAAEGSGATQYMIMDSNTTVINKNWANDISNTFVSWIFRRAPGFFDVVCYTGTGASATLNHNLGVAPNMVIVKGRSVISNWETYLSSLGGTGGNGLAINDSGAKSGTPPVSSATATTFTLNNGVSTSSGQTYVAYLFATLTGVSKVGSYTGTGTTKQIDCGFTAGARFVLIKRTDSSGDWYVWDSARGIVAGNDPYLLLNDTAAEVTGTDYIDTYSAGFEISSTAPAAINANGGTFIFLAIA